MKNRYAEAEAMVRDAELIAARREEAAAKVEREFARCKKRAADNAAAMNNLRGFRAAW